MSVCSQLRKKNIEYIKIYTTYGGGKARGGGADAAVAALVASVEAATFRESGRASAASVGGGVTWDGGETGDAS